MTAAVREYHHYGKPKIRPISDLRNHANEISRLCHDSDELVFITKNGKDALVVMSVATWERDQARLELHRLLDESLADERAGDRGIDVKTVRRRLMLANPLPRARVCSMGSSNRSRASSDFHREPRRRAMKDCVREDFAR